MKDADGWLSGLRADGGGDWSFGALQREGEAGWKVDVLGAGVVAQVGVLGAGVVARVGVLGAGGVDCWSVCGKVEKLL